MKAVEMPSINAPKPPRFFDNEISSKRVVGFACNQAFIFSFFYLGENQGLSLGDISFERVDLLFTLAFMVVGFLILRAHSRQSRQVLLLRPLLFVYAVAMAASSLLHSFAFASEALSGWQTVEGAVLGLSAAFILAAWGRVLGAGTLRSSVTEVFVGSLVGALICLACSLAPSLVVSCGLGLLPIVSVALIDVSHGAANTAVSSQMVPKGETFAGVEDSATGGTGTAVMLSISTAGAAKVSAAGTGARKVSATGVVGVPAVGAVGMSTTGDTAILSAKVMVGTICFGAAAGFMETYATNPGAMAIPYASVSFLLFGAFLVGALSLLASDGFGKGASLNKSYRLAIFMMLVGVIAVPVLQDAASPLPGEAVALAGYLGLQTVLISLFLVLARISGRDAVESFAVGFASLFAGEFVGVLLANLADLSQADQATPYVVVAIAGALALIGYVFLFTERDFSNLSEIATSRDAFDIACLRIAQRYHLSKREAEILPFAMRGRTADRIAQELSVSKSTVDTHIRRIYAKAEVHSRQELIDLGERESKAL